MKTKIAIFNDLKKTMHLQVQHEDMETDSHILKPATMKIVEIDLGVDSIPYFKVWESGQALLSFFLAEEM